jgi:hypothetical protein
VPLERLPGSALVLALLGALLRSGAGEEPVAAAPSLHAPWDRLLRANVTAEGWVDYESLKTRDAAELRAYLETLAATDVDRLESRDERKAFWINAHNALCVQTLIDAGLPAEVPHAVLFGSNIFTQRTHRLAGKRRSLDEIEHQILRRDFADPRLHAALVCGAQSSPRLRPEAYEARELDRQLDEECRSWIAVETTRDQKRKNSIDEGAKVLYLSKIFSWYAEDFGDSEERILDFVKRFADEPMRQFLETNKVRIQHLPFDWSLNRR